MSLWPSWRKPDPAVAPKFATFEFSLGTAIYGVEWSWQPSHFEVRGPKVNYGPGDREAEQGVKSDGHYSFHLPRSRRAFMVLCDYFVTIGSDAQYDFQIDQQATAVRNVPTGI